MVATRSNELTVTEAALALGVVRQTAWRWLRVGMLPGRYDGKHWHVSLDAVHALQRRRRTVARMIGALL
jgi:excisionase family DNA binding protein